MYVDFYVLRLTGLGACGGLLIATAIYLTEQASGVIWRKVAAAACLVAGVLTLILAVIS